MPRPPRRVPPQGAAGQTVTPTRPTATNAITAAIPPFMLETPPHAPFLTTPPHASANLDNSVVPEVNAPHRRQGRGRQHTPTANVNPAAEHSQVSGQTLGSAVSEGPQDEQSFLEAVQHETDDAQKLRGLRDISSLATWTLSSAKPGCALAQLRHPSSSHFWQSDGPQPHTLTLHFFKLVAIIKMRIYLDFDLDESYTPTKMKFFAGMSEGGLVEFGSWEVTETTDPETGEPRSNMDTIRGWIDIPLKGVGGRETRYHENADLDLMDIDEEHDSADEAAGKSLGKSSAPRFTAEHMSSPAMTDSVDRMIGGDVLKAMVVQVRICENHQNGKDTHVRGFQVFARDEASGKDARQGAKRNKKQKAGIAAVDDGEVGGADVVQLQPADWMGDPEIR